MEHKIQLIVTNSEGQTYPSSFTICKEGDLIFFKMLEEETELGKVSCTMDNFNNFVLDLFKAHKNLITQK